MVILIIITIIVVLSINVNRALNYNSPIKGLRNEWEHDWAKNLDSILLVILIVLILMLFVVLSC